MINGITAALTAFFALITKALPGSEQQLAQFKLRSPLIYARIKTHLINQLVRQAHRKQLTGAALTGFITFETGDMAQSEQNSLLVIVPQILNHLK